MQVHIRKATDDDLDDILSILNQEILGGTNSWETEPIEGESCIRWFEKYSHTRYPLLVAESSSKTVGWASLLPWADHGGAARTALTSIYIHPKYQRNGIGRQLLNKLINESRSIGHHVLIARIDTANEPARLLHLRAGFLSVGILHEIGFKFDQYRDAEILELQL